MNIQEIKDAIIAAKGIQPSFKFDYKYTDGTIAIFRKVFSWEDCEYVIRTEETIEAFPISPGISGDIYCLKFGEGKVWQADEAELTIHYSENKLSLQKASIIPHNPDTTYTLLEVFNFDVAN